MSELTKYDTMAEQKKPFLSSAEPTQKAVEESADFLQLAIDEETEGEDTETERDVANYDPLDDWHHDNRPQFEGWCGEFEDWCGEWEE